MLANALWDRVLHSWRNTSDAQSKETLQQLLAVWSSYHIQKLATTLPFSKWMSTSFLAEVLSESQPQTTWCLWLSLFTLRFCHYLTHIIWNYKKEILFQCLQNISWSFWPRIYHFPTSFITCTHMGMSSSSHSFISRNGYVQNPGCDTVHLPSSTA